LVYASARKKRLLALMYPSMQKRLILEAIG